MSMFLKDPNAVLDYAIDWSRWLDDDQIATSVWTVPDGLVEESDTNSTTIATVWISGGSAGTTYTITNRITTAGGRTEDRSILLKVEER